MKKVFIVLCFLAILMVVFTACEPVCDNTTQEKIVTRNQLPQKEKEEPKPEPVTKKIRFEGDGAKQNSRVTDAFFLEKGYYKIVFTTAGYGFVDILDFEGNQEMLFTVTPGSAVDGTEELFINPTDRKMFLNLTMLTDYYEIYIKKLD